MHYGHDIKKYGHMWKIEVKYLELMIKIIINFPRWSWVYVIEYYAQWFQNIFSARKRSNDIFKIHLYMRGSHSPDTK